MSTPDGLDPLGRPYEPPPPLKGLDPVGWAIAATHSLLGHDKAAAVLGQDPGDRSRCLICAYEREPTPDRKAAVISALGVPL